MISEGDDNALAFQFCTAFSVPKNPKRIIKSKKNVSIKRKRRTALQYAIIRREIPLTRQNLCKVYKYHRHKHQEHLRLFLTSGFWTISSPPQIDEQPRKNETRNNRDNGYLKKYILSIHFLLPLVDPLFPFFLLDDFMKFIRPWKKELKYPFKPGTFLIEGMPIENYSSHKSKACQNPQKYIHLSLLLFFASSSRSFCAIF